MQEAEWKYTDAHNDASFSTILGVPFLRIMIASLNPLLKYYFGLWTTFSWGSIYGAMSIGTEIGTMCQNVSWSAQ